jgi:DNA invertase Pin-like site-specific DNA recombinase
MKHTVTNGARTRAGLARARRRGTRLGRPPVNLDGVQLLRLRRRGLSIRAIAVELEVPKSTVADFLARHSR